MFFDAVGNRFQLPFAGAGAHDEIIHIGRQFAQIQQYDVFTLLVFNRVDDVVRKFQFVQKKPPAMAELVQP